MQCEVLELVNRCARSHLADYVLGLPADWVMYVVVCEIGSQFSDAFIRKYSYSGQLESFCVSPVQ